MREIALDTETTGLEPGDGHRVVEIGCVELMGGVRTGRFFHAYLDPERDMPHEAERVHGLSYEFLKGKPRFAEVAASFLAFIGDDPLVIHNAAFDMRFLNAELSKAGRDVLGFERAIDTVTMARKRHPGQPASLDALCRRFEIDLSKRTKHGALLDAELLADVYLELCGGRQANLSLAPEADEAIVIAAATVSAIPRRFFAPSPDELAAHRAFLVQITQPLWLQAGESA